MDLWGNIAQTLSLVLTAAALGWAVRTFGRSRARVDLEVETFQPKSYADALGPVIPVVKAMLEARDPDAYKKLQEAWPALKELGKDYLPHLVLNSPLLMRVWPSLAHLFNDSPRVSVTIHNVGSTAFSVKSVEFGDGKTWAPLAPHMMLQRVTDELPAVIRPGTGLEIWYVSEQLVPHLVANGLDPQRARVRVTTSPTGSTASGYFTVPADRTLEGAAV